MLEHPQSFFRRWRVAIVSGVLLVVVLVTVREFLDYRAGSPIIDPYLAVINETAARSPRVRQRLEQYYAKYQRRTVASKHYPWLCDEIQQLAARDGITKNLDCPILFDVYEKP
jgi:hypothetical protein